jgi:hypothetical protein
MRYISLFSHQPRDTQPTPEEMASMGKLIEAGLKAGWLIVTEGTQIGSKGTRVRNSDGEISVVDGPFAEAKEVVGGYAILRADSKEEAIGLCKIFLKEIGGEGTCELHQLYEMPAGGKI